MRIHADVRLVPALWTLEIIQDAGKVVERMCLMA